MRVGVARTGIVFLVVLSIALAVGTTTALAHKSKDNYKVDITRDVATRTSIITTGNRNGTKIGGDGATTFLDLDNESLSRFITHPSFGVCGSPVTQPLDDVEWVFKFIDVAKGRLVARFDPHGVPENQDECGFDDYTLRIVFELSEDDGPTGSPDGTRVYTSNGAARVVISHYAETDDPSKPKGKKDLTHHVPEGVRDVDLTVTITPVP